MIDAKRLQFDQKISDDIDREGTSVVGVFDPDGEQSSFAYTVGMTEMGQPEMIVCGISPQIAGHVLNDVRDRVKAGNLELLPGTVIEDAVAGGYQLMVCEVTDAHEANSARAFYLEPRFVQLVFQDMDYHWPWDPEYLMDARCQKDWWVRP